MNTNCVPVFTGLMQKPESLVVMRHVTVPVTGTFSPVSLGPGERMPGRLLGEHQRWGVGCTQEVRRSAAFVCLKWFLLSPFLADPSSEEHTACLDLVEPSLRPSCQRGILPC